MLSGEVFIPDTITVHLGLPDSDAANVTIPYISYLKNSACSEIYPTWPENSLRANIYVINTYALNRIYTEARRSMIRHLSTGASCLTTSAGSVRSCFRPISGGRAAMSRCLQPSVTAPAQAAQGFRSGGQCSLRIRA